MASNNKITTKYTHKYPINLQNKYGINMVCMEIFTKINNYLAKYYIYFKRMIYSTLYTTISLPYKLIKLTFYTQRQRNEKRKIYIYIYIYIEREREREREGERVCVCHIA